MEHLSSEKKNEIYKAIYDHMTPDDKYPCDVIADRYGGDEEQYLRIMASWHNIKID